MDDQAYYTEELAEMQKVKNRMILLLVFAAIFAVLTIIALIQHSRDILTLEKKSLRCYYNTVVVKT